MPKQPRPRAERGAPAKPRASDLDELRAAVSVAYAGLVRGMAGAAPEPPQPRHLEVLQAALELFAERGYAGASLRELARRVGMQQPSLYHWFDSKEQLVEQIIVHLGADLLTVLPRFEPPPRLADVPRWVFEYGFAIWAQPRYVTFVRFLFALGIEQPRYRPLIHAVYQRAPSVAIERLMQPFVDAGEIDAREAAVLVRLCINAIGLFLLEEKIFYGLDAPSPELTAFARDAVALLEDAIDARTRRRRATSRAAGRGARRA